jgi:6-phosphogluconolactonase
VALVTITGDEAQLAATAALRITTLLDAAIAARGAGVLCLTGGTTPARLYALLADDREPWRRRIDWPRIHVFWGDERHVPPDHPDSNFGMAHRTLLSRVPIPAAHIHRMRGEFAEASDAAAEYEPHLRRFDVMLLGLGEDAHIASLFPGSPLLEDDGAAAPPVRQVAAVWVEKLQTWRITLTPPVLLAAPSILMMVSGARKAAAVHAALKLADDVSTYPAHLLRRAGDRVEWIIDRAAAAPPPVAPPAR